MIEWPISVRWLRAQQLGILASILTTHPGVHPIFRAARKILQKELISTQTGPKGFNFYRSLPPWVLAVFVRALGLDAVPDLNTCSVLAQKALINNLLGRTDNTSTVARAQIFAYHILLAHTRIDGLLRLGRTLFGHHEKWFQLASDPVLLERMSSGLSLLRSRSVSTRDRCGSLKMLADTLSHAPFWDQVENILFHNQFSWPLLVFDSVGSAQRRPQTLAMSIPVSVDINFDNRSEIEQVTETGVIRPNWDKSLSRAVYAAKVLWRAEHQGYGVDCALIENASVIFDFTIGEMIVKEICEAGKVRISITDRSAEAYFAQVVLGKFLGRGNLMVNAVTGFIGDQITDPSGTKLPNFKFHPPKEISAKIEFARTSGVFECLILPESEMLQEGHENFTSFEPSLAVGNETPIQPAQTLELRYLNDLKSIADHLHPLGWRKHKYIRCPELEWAIHSEQAHGIISPDDERVRTTLAAMASSENAVSRLHVDPIIVASALCSINDCLILNDGRSGTLSWAFINIVGTNTGSWDEELDIFFWELFFAAVGNGPSEFLDFLSRPSRGAAVNQVIDRLNGSSDRPGRGRPDLIIIIGLETLNNSAWRTRIPSSRPFNVLPILKEVNNKLAPTGKTKESVYKLIGNLRLIFLPDSVSGNIQAEKFDSRDLTETEWRNLRLLSTCEDGFSTRTARLLFSHHRSDGSGMPLDRILSKFLERGLIKQVHGKYHVPQEVSRQIPDQEIPDEKLNRFYAVGAALAPYVMGGQGALSIGVDTVFAPSVIQEANRHFLQVMAYSRQTPAIDAGKMRKSSEEAMIRLARFLTAPSWSNVSRLLKIVSRLAGFIALEPYEKSCELLNLHEEACSPPHPFFLINAANAAVRAATFIHLYVQNPEYTGKMPPMHLESPLQLHVKAREWYLQAIRLCDGLPEFERAPALLFCLTKYVVHLCSRNWWLIGHETPIDLQSKEMEVQFYWDQIQHLMNSKVKLMVADCLECFELLGDRQPDHSKAFDIYSIGMGTGLFWSHLYLKACGAASLSGRPDWAHEKLKGFPFEKKAHLIFKARYGIHAKSSVWELNRIEEGFRIFEQFFRSEPKIIVLNSVFERDYGRKPVQFAQNLRPFIKGIVTELKAEQQLGMISSETGTLHQFQGIHLSNGLSFEEIEIGMELDFQIFNENSGRHGLAINLRRPHRINELPVQRGKISNLIKEFSYGFIALGEKDYYFHASRLSVGTAYEELSIGMEVDFQICSSGVKDEALNVCKVDGVNKSPDNTPQTLKLRGIIQELKRQSNYGFIFSIDRSYHFHASHLQDGLEYSDLHEGMEVEFEVLPGAITERSGSARSIRRVADSKTSSMFPNDGGSKNGGTDGCLDLVLNESGNEFVTGKITFFKQEKRFGFISTGKKQYYFRDSNFATKISYTTIYENMEVEFKIVEEPTSFRAGRADEIRLTELADENRTSTDSFHTGKICFLKHNGHYGFIHAYEKDFHFCASDLREGLLFKNLEEGMEVEFQIKTEGTEDENPSVMNVRPSRDKAKSKIGIANRFEESSVLEGVIYFIQKQHGIGYICTPDNVDYLFNASDLSDGVKLQDIFTGMQVRFKGLGKGRAAHVRLKPDGEPELIQRKIGVVYCLVPNLQCGFISSSGEEYQFTGSDLVGSKYGDVVEGCQVSFQIRKRPSSRAGKACNVCLLNIPRC